MIESEAKTAPSIEYTIKNRKDAWLFIRSALSLLWYGHTTVRLNADRWLVNGKPVSDQVADE